MYSKYKFTWRKLIGTYGKIGCWAPINATEPCIWCRPGAVAVTAKVTGLPKRLTPRYKFISNLARPVITDGSRPIMKSMNTTKPALNVNKTTKHRRHRVKISNVCARNKWKLRVVYQYRHCSTVLVLISSFPREKRTFLRTLLII